MIYFDVHTCMTAFGEHLGKYAAQARDEIYNDAQQGLKTKEAKGELLKDDVHVIAGIVTTAVTGGVWTVLDEFGTGSLLDESNPALVAYKASRMWNPARQDHKIRTRPNKPGQINIFGKPVKGRGKGGFDLEAAGVVKPQAPSHALRNAIKWMNNGRFRKILNQAVATFPWHQYVNVTNTRMS